MNKTIGTFVGVSFHGCFGNNPLQEEMDRILAILYTDNATRLTIVRYVFERAALQNLFIDHVRFETILADISHHLTDCEKYNYAECSLAVAHYYYKKGYYPKKALEYLKKAMTCKHTYYSATVLNALFYRDGFAHRKDHKKVVEIINDLKNWIKENKNASALCELSIEDYGL